MLSMPSSSLGVHPSVLMGHAPDSPIRRKEGAELVPIATAALLDEHEDIKVRAGQDLKALRPIDRSEVARADAWIILYDRVYDVADFLELHPGGDFLLKEWYGKDATAAFHGSHPPHLLKKSLPPGVALVGELSPSPARMGTIRLLQQGGISIAGLLRYGRIQYPEELRELLRNKSHVPDELIETTFLAKKHLLPGLLDQVERVAEPARIEKFRPTAARLPWEIEWDERWSSRPEVTPLSCRANRIARRKEMLERLGAAAFVKMQGPVPAGGNHGPTGIKFIDEQHDVIDKAFDRIREDRSQEALDSLINALDEHFRDEEHLLIGVGFPEEQLATHRSQHFSIMTWVREQQAPVKDNFVDYCQRRFNLHSAQADDHYIRFIACDDFDPRYAMRGGVFPEEDFQRDGGVIHRLIHMSGFLCCRTDAPRGACTIEDTEYGPGL